MKLFSFFRKTKRIANALTQIADTTEYKGKSAEWKFNEAIKLLEKGDLDLSISLLKESADSDYSPAQYQLGNMLIRGEEIEQDYVLGFDYLMKAAEHNCKEACFDIGYLYQNGFGCKQDYYQSFVWYKKSAENGFPDGMHQVGVFYYQGIAIEKNIEEAIKWFKKAAKLKCADSLAVLGDIYYMEGRDEESYNLLLEASELGSEDAKMLLEDEVYDQFR